MEQIYKVVDGSWTYKIGLDGLESTYGTAIEGQQYKLLADNCILPTCVSNVFNGCYGPSKKNDCIIMDINDGAVIFIHREFLVKINRCSHCGHVIE